MASHEQWRYIGINDIRTMPLSCQRNEKPDDESFLIFRPALFNELGVFSSLFRSIKY